jgi:hypothetical protein
MQSRQALRAAQCASVLVAVVLTVSAAAAAPPAVGPIVHAGFESWDPSGCVNTTVAVFVRGLRGSANLRLSISQLDECNDVALLRSEADAKLKAGAFSVTPDLALATLKASVPMTDTQSGEQFVAAVNLTWTSTERAVSAGVRVLPEQPGRFTRVSGVARDLRLAKASGTVSRDGENFTPKPATDAAISMVRATGPAGQ